MLPFSLSHHILRRTPSLPTTTITRIPRQQLHQRRSYACQIHHPTKLGALRSKLRAFGGGHIEFDLNHSPGLALLTLSNPAKHNALTGKMMAELADCVDFLEQATTDSSASGATVSAMANTGKDEQGGQAPQLHPGSGLVLKSAGQAIERLEKAHVQILQGLVGVIITGAQHKSYCAGLDLSAAKTTLLTPEAGSEMSALMVSTLTRFLRLPLITIAAIEKAAVGGGAEMTTFCDHRCIAEKARVQFVQTQMGVVTGWGGASRLLNLVPRSRALRLLASAEPIMGGEEAVREGFAQLIAPSGKAVESATEYMQQYVWERRPVDGQEEGARRCVEAARAFKRIVSFGVDDENVERVTELEKDLFKRLWGGKDNLARVEAASSKKK
ncbi:ClpP/crotonase-like domain-containing protein [Gamsiella multidivaricata]|uniref:ClpP/crotonase-like domain-containing protein n=1 Tax=Gamsiella multidivaricata TaxID=101098 RepID=UPI00221E668E|nr:ClpP/crotonase-like domain-containing protein [Gamsiella multidivaricata]KAG0363788.1 enoyl CoA hydratase domain-containing protein 1 [Gamsiella multidivaricata]KAI7818067.1 ClpP/crotonase-like domain-containing protein [Gamsiella multidivaricata]